MKEVTEAPPYANHGGFGGPDTTVDDPGSAEPPGVLEGAPPPPVRLAYVYLKSSGFGVMSIVNAVQDSAG